MSALLIAALGTIEVILILVTAYVVVLTVGSFLPQKRSHIASRPAKRFAVLIPAHDEELLIGVLLDSLNKLDYPRTLFDVHVVADNCTDSTASIAGSYGAEVHERQDSSLIGKGYALRWLLDEVSRSGQEYDAFIILDADSIVSSNFLRVMNDRLLAGSLVIQAYYAVANLTDSWSTALRYVALSLVHYLRPMGKRVFGGSAGLKGNGMCFAASVMRKHGWNTFTLTEDIEYHLKLVSEGIKVDFAPEAVVWAEMPTSLRGAQSQNMRWERGRLEMIRKYVPRLLWLGLATRNLAQVDAALEQLVPPFSVPVALSGLCLLGSIIVGSQIATLVAIGLILCQLLYVIGGLVLIRAPRHVYLSLLGAPIYVAWKSWLYVAAFSSRRQQKWIRTSRI